MPAMHPAAWLALLLLAVAELLALWGDRTPLNKPRGNWTSAPEGGGRQQHYTDNDTDIVDDIVDDTDIDIDIDSRDAHDVAALDSVQ